MLRSPAQLLFALGIALLWAGIVPWIVFVAFDVGGLQSVFHSISLVQGFGTCFASGFVFLAAERAKGADGGALPRPGPVVVGLACLGPVGVSVCAFFELLAASQMFWLAGVGAVTAFAVRCWRRLPAEQRSPVVAVWLLAGLSFGVAGTGVIAAFGMAGLSWEWHQMGRAWLLQGMLLSFAFARGLLLRSAALGLDGVPPLKGPRTHLCLVVALAATWAVESFDLAGHAGTVARFARGAVVLWYLEDSLRLRRWPIASIWIAGVVAAFWSLAVGYFLVAFVPAYSQVGLHTVFIGGFACLALTILGLDLEPLQRLVLLAAVAVALGARILFALDPPRAHLWLMTASVAILVATLAWVPQLRQRPRG